MAPTQPAPSRPLGIERVRAEVLTAVHFGRLRPGDQVPSVRRLARRTGLNRKTVHRAYQRLAAEGLLEVRPGSGTYLSESLDRPPDLMAGLSEILALFRRFQAEADRLGLDGGRLAEALAAFAREGYRGMRVWVTECNEEQAHLVAGECRRYLGLDATCVLLDALAREPGRFVGPRAFIVTTECHRRDVHRAVGSHDAEVACVSLDAWFPQALLKRAARAPVYMVVRDPRYRPVLLRLLGQYGATPEALSRIRVLTPRTAPPALRRANGGFLYISPTVEGWSPPQAVDLEPWKVRRHLDLASLERLRVHLSLASAGRAARAAT